MICDFCLKNIVKWAHKEAGIRVCKELECFLKAQKLINSKDLEPWDDIEFSRDSITTQSKFMPKSLCLYDKDIERFKSKETHFSPRFMQAIINKLPQDQTIIYGPFDEFQLNDTVTTAIWIQNDKSQLALFFSLITSDGEQLQLTPVVVYKDQHFHRDAEYNLSLNVTKTVLTSAMQKKIVRIESHKVIIIDQTIFYNVENNMLNILRLLLSQDFSRESVLQQLAKKEAEGLEDLKRRVIDLIQN